MAKYLSIYNEKECRIISDDIKNYCFVEVLGGDVLKSKWNRYGLIPFDINSEIVAIEPPINVSIGLPEVNSEGLFIKHCNDWEKFKKEVKIYKFKSGYTSKTGVGIQVWDEKGNVVFNSSEKQMKIIDNIKISSEEDFGYHYPFLKKNYGCDVAIMPVYGPKLRIDGGDDGGGNYIEYSEYPCIGLSSKSSIFLESNRQEFIGDPNLYLSGLPFGCFANFLIFNVEGLKGK